MRDNKSKNKINKMLKVIKSANKSVIQEEGDGQDDTRCLEPDEDDYGYVSQESSALYKRLMEKYKDVEVNKTDTVVARPQAKPLTPVAVKSTGGGSGNAKTTKSSSAPASKSVSKPVPTTNPVRGKTVDGKAGGAVAAAPKPRRPPPPVVNFEALLKLAEKKQFEPIKVDQSDLSRKDERPMTLKEKREHEERQRMAEARKRRLETENYNYRRTEPEPSPKTPATSVAKRKPEVSVKSRPTIKPATVTSSVATTTTATKRDPVKPSNGTATNNRPQAPVTTRQFPPPDVQKTRTFPPEDVPRRAPASSRPFPPADVRRKGPAAGPGPSRDFKRELRREMVAANNTFLFLGPRRMEEEEYEDDDYGYDENEEDYDSEMDDFIDDGPLGQADVSECIKEIFGYDKHRYRDEDYDDREMESSFAQQMREESYSRKIGRLEDEADMRQEALDKARKAALKRASKRN